MGSGPTDNAVRRRVNAFNAWKLTEEYRSISYGSDRDSSLYAAFRAGWDARRVVEATLEHAAQQQRSLDDMRSAAELAKPIPVQPDTSDGQFLNWIGLAALFVAGIATGAFLF